MKLRLPRFAGPPGRPPGPPGPPGPPCEREPPPPPPNREPPPEYPEDPPWPPLGPECPPPPEGAPPPEGPDGPEDGGAGGRGAFSSAIRFLPERSISQILLPETKLPRRIARCSDPWEPPVPAAL